MSRRVVVTGVGLVCGLGIGTDEVWKNLLAGKSGVRSITQFDTTGFDCTIAGEVRDFDPLHWVGKKRTQEDGAVHPDRAGCHRLRRSHGGI